MRRICGNLLKSYHIEREDLPHNFHIAIGRPQIKTPLNVDIATSPFSPRGKMYEEEPPDQKLQCPEQCGRASEPIPIGVPCIAMYRRRLRQWNHGLMLEEIESNDSMYRKQNV